MEINKQQSNQMWGGRFTAKPSDILEQINESISVDKRLAFHDIKSSKAHAHMLASVHIITKDECQKILNGLNEIEKEIISGTFVFKTDLEDIHMNIESRLAEIIGSDIAGKLHTARSRNDQIATDLKLWVRDACEDFIKNLKSLQKALLLHAEQHIHTIMPGFTHLQCAQPITFAHHMMAYVEMLQRDIMRVMDAKKRLNECPLGASALAGTSFPIDRVMTAEMLGFDKPTNNSIDSVSDRDFVMEYISVLSICAIHCSRLAEEIVLWNSYQFQFVQLSDAFTTGSSIMPQKKNPDAAELIRAKSGMIIGALNNILIVMKGLPLAYSKDMQEDKKALFDAHDAMMISLLAMTGMISDMSVNKEKLYQAAKVGFVTATDLADWLVKNLNIPFRKAHAITGKIVVLAESKGRDLSDLPLADMQLIEPNITEDVYTVLSVEASVNSKTSFGGTAPDNIKQMIEYIKYDFFIA